MERLHLHAAQQHKAQHAMTVLRIRLRGLAPSSSTQAFEGNRNCVSCEAHGKMNRARIDGRAARPCLVPPVFTQNTGTFTHLLQP